MPRVPGLGLSFWLYRNVFGFDRVFIVVSRALFAGLPQACELYFVLRALLEDALVFFGEFVALIVGKPLLPAQSCLLPPLY